MWGVRIESNLRQTAWTIFKDVGWVKIGNGVDLIQMSWNRCLFTCQRKVRFDKAAHPSVQSRGGLFAMLDRFKATTSTASSLHIVIDLHCFCLGVQIFSSPKQNCQGLLILFPSGTSYIDKHTTSSEQPSWTNLSSSKVNYLVFVKVTQRVLHITKQVITLGQFN